MQGRGYMKSVVVLYCLLSSAYLQSPVTAIFETTTSEEVSHSYENISTPEPEHCAAENVTYRGLVLTFPRTTQNEVAWSDETCDEGSSHANLALATRRCNAGQWAKAELEKCFTQDDAEDEIKRLGNISLTKDNVEQVAGKLSILTLQTNLTDDNVITSVIESLEEITSVNSSSLEVSRSVVEIISDLLTSGSDVVHYRSSSIRKSLQGQLSLVQTNPKNFSSIEDALAVEARKFDPEITKELVLVDSRPNKNNGESQSSKTQDLSDGNITISNSDAHMKDENSIYLPPDVLKQGLQSLNQFNTIPITFVIYDDDSLFQTNATDPGKDDSEQDQYKEVIGSKVMSATVEGTSIRDLSSPVVTRLLLSEENDNWEVRKRYWCVTFVENTGNGHPSWSDDGCTLTMQGNMAECKCSHLSSFAVLVGVGVPPMIDRILSFITWIGSSLSIIGLTFCTVCLSGIKALRSKQSSHIHINLSISLIAFYVTFLTRDLVRTPSVHCKNIASAVHYFCLTTVSWMTVEAVNMYYLFVMYERNSISYFIPVSLLLAYGLPLVPVIIVFRLASSEQYMWCFLPKGNFLYFGFLLEVFILVLTNIVIFILVVRKVVFRRILSTTAQLKKKREIFLRIQQFVLFWSLLGLSWIFGFLSILPNWGVFLFEILFCLLTSLQGFVLFIFIGAKNPEVRQFFMSWKKKKEVPHLNTSTTEINMSTLPRPQKGKRKMSQSTSTIA